MKRIAIIGSSGAGKSTLARQLGAILGIDVIHLDSVYWKPGWVETPRNEWIKIQEELVRRDRWIIDGNYGATLDVRLAAADTVIFLDFPRAVCLWRAVRRRFQNRGKTRPDMGPGCPEKLDWDFLKWIWTFPQRTRPVVLAKLEHYRDGKRIITLRNPSQVRQFLDGIRRGGG